MRRRLEELLDKLDWALKMLDAFLVTRDPAAAKSAEAFEGLRSTIEASGRGRRRHLTQLATIDVSLRLDESPDRVLEIVRSQIQQFAQLEGLKCIDAWQEDLAPAFSIDGPPSGSTEVIVPAYVDEADGTLVKEGVARRTRRAEIEPLPETDTGEGE
ncbi:MAG: hypothetical protein H0T94_10380 [Acidimicrobiia bacterium]|nr:hypothetical protein [Acidimicrobiia bacterium]